MEKFQCGNCGRCCLNLRSPDAGYDEKRKRGLKEGVYYLIKNRENSIKLFEWEKRSLESTAEKNGLEMRTKPYFVLLDKDSKTFFSPLWILDHDQCPFLAKDERCACKIYKERPLICRAFPVLSSGLSNSVARVSSLCPNSVTIDATGLKSLRKMVEFYDESFFYAVKAESVNAFLRRIVREMESEGIISLTKGLSVDSALRKIEKIEYNEVFKFGTEKGFLNRDEIERFLANVYLIDDVRVCVNEILRGKIIIDQFPFPHQCLTI